MPRIDVPDGQDPLMHLWGATATHVSGPAAKFSDAVYSRRTLSLREFEAARISIARVNDCNICLNLRTDGGPDQAFYDSVLGERDGLTDRESLASEFAQRFATDHLSMDDDLWERLHAAYDDTELVELGLAVGSWLAFGRLNRVFDVDGVCRIPLNPHGGGHLQPAPHV